MALFDPEYSGLSSHELSELDRVCGEFERQRIAGKHGSLEQYLKQHDLVALSANRPATRTLLIQELLRIDIEISLDWDDAIDCEGYVARFPNHAEFIQSTFAEAACRTHKDEAEPWSLDTPRALGGDLDTPRDSNGLSGNLFKKTDCEDSESLPNSSKPASQQSRFRVIRNLAAGGIGTVYVGMDRDLDREVAIKVLKRKFASDPSILARFRAEATITSHLEHPNIVPVYAIGERSDGLPFYAMRLVRGRSLQQAIDKLHAAIGGTEAVADFRSNADCRDLLMRFIAACRAAAFAHSRGIVHRDIKPSNIMVDDFGETLLVDWGLATRVQLADDHPKSLASTTRIVGTPGYMSPEQAAGLSDSVDARSDIYALGATLLTLLTHQIPRSQLNTGTEASGGTRKDTHVVLQDGKRIVGSAVDHAWRTRRLPRPLHAILNKALRNEPSERYGSAERLADDLESWLADEPISVVSDSVPVKMRRWMKQHRAITGAAFAGAACATIALFLGTLMLAAQNEELRQANEREQIASKAAVSNASRAEASAKEAVKQRERMLSVLDRFLIDVERGLTGVPGGAKVQRNVLVTVLNQLDEISQEFGYDGEADLSNAVALLDLASLFARVGSSNVELNVKSAEIGKGTPLEVAERLATEAWKVAEHVQTTDSVQLLATRAQILERQADIFRQTGRAELSLARLNEALELRLEIEELDSESIELAIDGIGTSDLIGQYYLQNKLLDRAAEIFAETHRRAALLQESAPNDLKVLRTVAIAYSRLGDIANANGELDEAEKWFDKDMELTEQIYKASPESATAKRDLTVSLDRLGRTRENRGQLEQAIEAYEASRQLRTELLEAEPNDLRFLRELFVSNFKLGATEMVLQRFEDAKRYYRQADELARHMAAVDKSNTIAKRYQSMCAESMCDILLSESKADEALPFAVLSFDITQELAEISPLDANIQQDLFVLHTKIAKVHKLRGDFDACIRELESTLEQVEASVVQSDRSLTALENYSYLLARLGDAGLRAAKPELAVYYLERMLEHEATIPREKRSDADSQRLLVNTHTLLGEAYIQVEQFLEAYFALMTARETAQAMILADMRVEQMKADLEEINQLLVVCGENIGK